MGTTRYIILATMALAAAGCSPTVASTDNLPTFTGEAMKVGALLCITAPSAARAPDLERAAVVAEEFINGSARLYPELPAENIPCRKTNSCGVWMGRDASGRPLRGPIRLVIGDDDERVARSVAAARRMVEEEQVQAIVGICDPTVMKAVYSEVTKTDVVLVTPVVTADEISDLGDRTPTDQEQSLPGYVFRTVTPDYIQMTMLGLVGRNHISRKPLVRYEDQTGQTCREHAECSAFGADYECRVSSRTAEPEREFTRTTDFACAGKEEGFCSQFGLGYSCAPVGSGGREVCAQSRSVRYCTRVVQPQSAMVLHDATPSGERMKETVVDFWGRREEGVVLTTVAFDPRAPASFSERIETLFRQGDEAFGLAKAQGLLPAAQSLGDTVVFLLGDATSSALLLQEWSTQLSRLGIDGADRVFWVGPNTLHSSVLIDQLDFQTVRNLYVTDPAAVDTNNHPFFEKLFTQRWGAPPSSYSANLFDSILLVALANEHAGRERSLASSSGPLDANTAAALKNSLPIVSSGCFKRTLAESCEIQGISPVTVQPESFHDAIQSVAAGKPIRLHGASGSLDLSPAGDRIGEINLWKIEPAGRLGRFFLLDTLTPQESGIGLTK